LPKRKMPHMIRKSLLLAFIRRWRGMMAPCPECGEPLRHKSRRCDHCGWRCPSRATRTAMRLLGCLWRGALVLVVSFAVLAVGGERVLVALKEEHAGQPEADRGLFLFVEVFSAAGLAVAAAYWWWHSDPRQ